MSNPFVGEIRMFAGNFAPIGWMFCQGQSLLITQYETLFNLIGTTYGGNGVTTFSLPDLRGRFPIHQGTGLSTYVIGQSAGVENVTLTTQQLPAHTHGVQANVNTSSSTTPLANYFGAWAAAPYSDQPPNSTMNPSTVSMVGGGQSHLNRSPYLAVSFIISLFGIFPSRS